MAWAGVSIDVTELEIEDRASRQEVEHRCPSRSTIKANSTSARTIGAVARMQAAKIRDGSPRILNPGRAASKILRPRGRDRAGWLCSDVETELHRRSRSTRQDAMRVLLTAQQRELPANNFRVCVSRRH